MRLIDADELKEWECERCEYENKDEYCKESCGVMQRIDESPTVDAEPIRHGKWIWVYGWVSCSVCGCEPPSETNITSDYCPNCGAKMDEVTE